jgi:hypothetical protein
MKITFTFDGKSTVLSLEQINAYIASYEGDQIDKIDLNDQETFDILCDIILYDDKSPFWENDEAEALEFNEFKSCCKVEA